MPPASLNRAEIREMRRALSSVVATVRGMDSRLAEMLGEAEPTEVTWLELPAAAERFKVKSDTLRKLCRQQGFGRKVGARWQVNVPKMQERQKLSRCREISRF